MMDLLKKIGLPATVATVISVLVTITPFLFKLDERYAKSAELEELIKKNDEKIIALTNEIGKLTGVTEVLVTVMSQEAAQVRQVSPSRQRQRPIVAAPTQHAIVLSESATPPATSSSAGIVVEPVSVPNVPSESTLQDRQRALAVSQEALKASQRNLQQIKGY